MMYRYQEKHSKNTIGNDYVVGDIHGMYDLLMKNLEEMDFDFEKDRLFSVGDLIDRGPKNVECLGLLNEPWFYAVVGNHEDMMVRYIKSDEAFSWIMNGGKWGIDLEDDGTLPYYVDLVIKECPLSRIVETDVGEIGICHAQPMCNEFKKEPKNRNEYNTMIWGRSLIQHQDYINMDDVYMTIHGHTPLDKPCKLGDQLYIDTGAVFGGELTFIKIQGTDA